MAELSLCIQKVPVSIPSISRVGGNHILLLGPAYSICKIQQRNIYGGLSPHSLVGRSVHHANNWRNQPKHVGKEANVSHLEVTYRQFWLSWSIHTHSVLQLAALVSLFLVSPTTGQPEEVTSLSRSSVTGNSGTVLEGRPMCAALQSLPCGLWAQYAALALISTWKKQDFWTTATRVL